MGLTAYQANLLRLNNEVESSLVEFAKNEGQNFIGYVKNIISCLNLIRIVTAEWNVLWDQTYAAIKAEITDLTHHENNLIAAIQNKRTKNERLFELGKSLARCIHADVHAEDFLRIAKPSTYMKLEGIVFEVLLVTSEEGKRLRKVEQEYVDEKKKIITAQLKAVEKIESREMRHARLREKYEKKYNNNLVKLIEEYEKEEADMIKDHDKEAHADTVFLKTG